MNPDDRRQHLLEVAAACVAEHGTTVSMDRVAEAAQISKPLMRHYFKNRDGLLTALFDRDVASIVEIFTQRDRGSLVEHLDEYLGTSSSGPGLIDSGWSLLPTIRC